MPGNVFHSLSLCISHIIRATSKTKSLIKSLTRTIPSHGSVTWLSGICRLGYEVSDLMLKPPVYWNPLSKRTVFPCMSSCQRWDPQGCRYWAPMEGVKEDTALPSGPAGIRIHSPGMSPIVQVFCLLTANYASPFFLDSQNWWNIHDKDHLRGMRLGHKLNTLNGTGPYIICLPLGY